MGHPCWRGGRGHCGGCQRRKSRCRHNADNGQLWAVHPIFVRHAQTHNNGKPWQCVLCRAGTARIYSICKAVGLWGCFGSVAVIINRDEAEHKRHSFDSRAPHTCVVIIVGSSNTVSASTSTNISSITTAAAAAPAAAAAAAAAARGRHRCRRYAWR